MRAEYVSGGRFNTVSFQHDIAQAAIVEERCNGVRSDVLITVHHEDNMLTVGGPSVDFACEIIKYGLSWFSVLFFGLEVGALLSPRGERRGCGFLAGAVCGDNA